MSESPPTLSYQTPARTEHLFIEQTPERFVCAAPNPRGAGLRLLLPMLLSAPPLALISCWKLGEVYSLWSAYKTDYAWRPLAIAVGLGCLALAVLRATAVLWRQRHWAYGFEIDASTATLKNPLCLKYAIRVPRALLVLRRAADVSLGGEKMGQFRLGSRRSLTRRTVLPSLPMRELEELERQLRAWLEESPAEHVPESVWDVEGESSRA